MASLATIADGNAFFALRLHSEVWSTATDEQKQLALNEATEIINRFTFQGNLAEVGQVNVWPRVLCGTSITPNAILSALFLIAYALLDGVDIEKELRGVHVTSRGYSAARTTYDTSRTPEHILAGVPSAMAWAYLCPFLQNPGAIKLSRVS